MVFNRKTLYSGKSDYSSYKVIEGLYNGRMARVLYGGASSPQSGIALDESAELLFSYNQRLLEIILSQQPSKLFAIGGGVFILPTMAHSLLPKVTIDVAEIDPLLVDIARDHFELPASDRLNIHIQDGATYIQKSKTKYDLIVIDAFSGFTIPPHLYQHDTLMAYKNHLTKDGVVAFNFISRYTPKKHFLADELIAAFQEVFGYVAIYQADSDYNNGDEQNYILVASTNPTYFDYLQSEEITIK